jgi:fructokinase
VRIVSVGEILWDVIGETEYLGGAPLNFAAHAQKLGHEVFLVSAVGEDERGRRALDRLRQRGISTEFVQVLPDKNTGTAEVELDGDGKPMFRIVRPAAYECGAFPAGESGWRRTTPTPVQSSSLPDPA